MSVARRRPLALLLVLAVLPSCVLPSSWDARTNGGRCDPGPDDPLHNGQWGVEDHRSGSQNALGISFGTDD